MSALETQDRRLWLAVAAAAVTWLGAVAAPPVPLAVAVVACALAAVWRRAPVALVALALLAGALGHRAWEGLDQPVPSSLQAEAVLAGDPRPIPGGVRVEVVAEGRRWDLHARGSAAGTLRPLLSGERIELAAAVQPRRAHDRWRASRHVAGTLSPDKVTYLGPGTWPTQVANAIHRCLDGGASHLAPTVRGLLAGLVVGDTRLLPAEVDFEMRVAGLSHLTAVSGQNVAFVLVVFGPLLGRLRARPRLAATLGVLAWFALLTRFEPSVLRATVMAALAVSASTAGWRVPTVARLSGAITVLVLADPFLVGTAPFQLSVAATTGIAVLAGPIAAALRGPEVLRQSVALTLSAQIGVAPVLVWLFDEMPLVSVPANIVVSQLAGWLMIWGLTAGIVAGALAMVIAPVVHVVHVPTSVLAHLVAEVGHRGAAVPLGSLHPSHVVGLYVCSALVLLARRLGRLARPVRLGAVVVALSILAAGALTVPRQEPGMYTPSRGIEMLLGEEGAVVVIDGRADPGEVLGALRDHGVRRAPVVIARSEGSRTAAVVRAVRHRFAAVTVVAPAHSALGDVHEVHEAMTIALAGLDGVVVVTLVGDRLTVSWPDGEV